MKKVNFLIGTLSIGGAERVISNLSLNLDENIEKNIVLFGSHQKTTYPYKGNIISLDQNENSGIIKKIKNFVHRVNSVRKLKNEKDSITISFLEYPNLLNLITKNNGKTIISVRNHMSKKHNKGLKSYLWKIIISKTYNSADKIVVVSKEIKRDLITNFGINENLISVIYNSYPINEIEFQSKNNNIVKAQKLDNYICTVGRLNHQKGHHHLIRVFSEVKKIEKNLKLVIVGDGPLKNDLIDLTKKLKIQQDVKFLGFIDNPFEIISNSKIFVLSSLYEGFPNALLEAMICNVPVIATRCPSGPEEILEPKESKRDEDLKYGFLISELDGKQKQNDSELIRGEKEMLDSIINLLQNQELYEEYKALSKIRSNDFNIKNIIKDWNEIIYE